VVFLLEISPRPALEMATEPPELVVPPQPPEHLAIATPSSSKAALASSALLVYVVVVPRAQKQPAALWARLPLSKHFHC
jgi:hypothetical protein